MHNLTYQYLHRPNSTTAYLILHGISEGISSDFIRNIYSTVAATGDSVLALNFPYIDARSKPSPDMADECAALQTAFDFLQGEGYTNVSIIAKSLGGIVTSHWLEQHPDSNVNVSILGYVLGDVHTAALKGKLHTVIQGANDRFGNAAVIQTELDEHDVTAKVVEIDNADHSYRDGQGNPSRQEAAMEQLMRSPGLNS